jgi:NADP-dependent 3-hydroxy acid dehydrogenase YdfG
MAPIHVTKLLFPMMKDNGWGAIINLVSIAGMEFFKGSAAYCASKHCARAFSNTLFEDIRQHNIKVCTINPGYVNTPLLDDKPELDRSKMIQPDDIAQTILFVCKFPQTGCPTEIVIKPQLTPKQQA